MASEEIEAIERYFGGRLPQQYRHLLAAIGDGAGYFFMGTDMFGSRIRELRADAIELAQNDAGGFVLPEDAFVFSMHGGYQFQYFRMSEGDDPPVYLYLEEDGSKGRVAERLSE